MQKKPICWPVEFKPDNNGITGETNGLYPNDDEITGGTTSMGVEDII